jgi:hypothetical protein
MSDCRFCFLILATTAGLGLSGGCGPRTGGPIAATVRDTGQTTVIVGELKLEVDPELIQNGIVVQEKQREGRKLLLAIRSTIKDHESTNYAYLLFDGAGKQLSSSGFSGPGRKKDEDFEVELTYDDMPTATRMVIAPFRLLKSEK